MESSTLRSPVLLAEPASGLPAITAEALAGERDFVRRNIPLDKVLRGIRFGHAGMARASLDACETHVEQPRLPEEMKAVSEELFRYVDSFADAMVQRFILERELMAGATSRADPETAHSGGVVPGRLVSPYLPIAALKVWVSASCW